MTITPRRITLLTCFKLPVVFLMGIRVKTIDETSCSVSVKHRWINQNPFKSMFWAVQGMAAELSTGVLMMAKIQEKEHKMTMLVGANKATFTKKARGRILFVCHDDSQQIDQALQRAIATGEGQRFWLTSTGTDAQGIVVSTFHFEWYVKCRS